MGARSLNVLACVLLLLFVFSDRAPAADLGVEVRVDREVYVLGQDTLVLSVSGHNDGPGVNADVHIALGTPDGTIYEVPGWSTDFTPILRDVYLQQGFSFPMSELCSYAVGQSSLPATQPGQYWFAAAFTSPYTLDFIADVSFDWFEVKEAETGWSTGYISVQLGSYYDDEEGWLSLTEASAEFSLFDEEPELTIHSLLRLPVDSCVVTARDSKPDVGNLDAGSYIDMFGSPKGDVRIPKLTNQQDIWYEKEDMDDEYYSAGRGYRFVGYGGKDVGAFDVTVLAPPEMELSHPSLDDDVVIHRDEPLSVNWRSRGSCEIVIGIEAWDNGTNAPRFCTCRCADDGEFTIPASILAQLPTGAWGEFPGLWVARANTTSFAASGLGEDGFALALSLVYGPVTIE